MYKTVKIGKKIGFLVIIIGETLYQVKIGDETWAFVDTYDPGVYDKIIFISGTVAIIRT